MAAWSLHPDRPIFGLPERTYKAAPPADWGWGAIGPGWLRSFGPRRALLQRVVVGGRAIWPWVASFGRAAEGPPTAGCGWWAGDLALGGFVRSGRGGPSYSGLWLVGGRSGPGRLRSFGPRRALLQEAAPPADLMAPARRCPSAGSPPDRWRCRPGGGWRRCSDTLMRYCHRRALRGHESRLARTIRGLDAGFSDGST